MSLIHNTAAPSVSQHMTGFNADTKGSEEEVNRLCQLYPEIASWQPALIAGATLKADGQKVIVTGASSIRLQCGASVIELSPAMIEIKSPLVKINC